MTADLTPALISQAFITACLTEVRALKPGNVHIYAGGHGMQVADFETSARVAAPYIANPNLKTGERILRAVEATFAAVHCNTNLGILLLCAPLAVAAQLGSGGTLVSRLQGVLDALDAHDAAHVFKAIATANPGGLGRNGEADVNAPPPASITLLDAMRMAGGRDLIANEYVTGFDRVFALHAHEYQPRLAAGWAPEDAIARVYLFELARTADTHIARKFGLAKAEAVRWRAAAFESAYFSSPDTRPSTPGTQAALLEFDTELKAEGLNPGSLADIMAAILFVSELELCASTP